VTSLIIQNTLIKILAATFLKYICTDPWT